MKSKTLFLLALATCMMCGCQQETSTTKDTHGHKHEKLSVMVDQIKGFRDSVKTAFEAGTPGDCDGALHDAAHVLEEVSHATDFGELSAEDQASAKTCTKTLFDSFMKIHDGFHGGEADATAYDGVKDAMEAEIATLESLVEKLAAP